MESRRSPDGERRAAQHEGLGDTTLKEPQPPFPEQHQTGPGLESKLDPR
jgi:hypothetical protein